MLASASLLTMLIIVQSPVTHAQSSNWYAGYEYLGHDGSPAQFGVLGSIYTINSQVSGANWYAQWVSVILSYRLGYWVQVGYDKGYDTSYKLQFYVEKFDLNGHGIWYKPNVVSAGTTYTYYIQFGSSNYWTAAVTGQFTQNLSTNPTTPTDYSAQSEMTTSSINIGGTHFSSLQYGATLHDWYSWDKHVTVVSSPYSVNPISNYEFTAGGGG